jgi:hypothetical protein
MSEPPPTALRKITICGPDFDSTSGRGPFWAIEVASPAFGPGNVNPPEMGKQLDRVHPFRTLAMEANTIQPTKKTSPKTNPSPRYQAPTLLTAHVIVGAKHESGYGDSFKPEDHSSLKVIVSGLNGHPVNSGNGAVFKSSLTADGEAAFQQVLLAPMGKQWPGHKENQITAPPFRLVQGEIRIAIQTAGLGWIDKAARELFFGKTEHTTMLRLRPDGIVLEGRLPFYQRGEKGWSAAPTDGRFLIAPNKRGNGIVIRLLTDDHMPGGGDWSGLWEDLLKHTAEANLPELSSLARPPAFEWEATITNDKITGWEPYVRFPGADLTMRLSNQGTETAQIRPYDWYISFPAKNGEKWPHDDWPRAELPMRNTWGTIPLLTCFQKSKEDNPEKKTLLKWEETGEETGVSLVPQTTDGKGVSLSYDEVTLARTLREAYGLPELGPGIRDEERSLLAVFLPQEDGWLQVPVPNFPEPDPSKDNEVIASPVPSPPNVLEGALRFENAGNDGLPWSATLQGSKGVAFAMQLGEDGKKSVALFFDPNVSFRGLLWFASDRPDAREALPRLGAGPGAFLDLPLETQDVEAENILAVTLKEFKADGLELSLTFNGSHPKWLATFPRISEYIRNDPGVNEPPPWTDWNGAVETEPCLATLKNAFEVIEGGQFLSGKFPTWTGDAGSRKAPDISVPPLPAVLWTRHRTMPLVSAMPATRSAAGAAHVLESRDLVPFAVKWDNTPPALALSNRSGSPFLAVSDSSKVKPLSSWLWPATGTELGNPLVAVGVPGVELAFPKEKKWASVADAWKQLRYALRIDNPASDEAFATATFPSVQKVDDPNARALPPPPPPAVAYDWVDMAELWKSNARKRQLARVAHSHLVEDFQATGEAVEANVVDLVRGETWKPLLGFAPPDPLPDAIGESLPYGAATIVDSAKGNQALKGYPGTKTEIVLVGGNKVAVLGYSAETFLKGGHLVDSRGIGVRQTDSSDTVLRRNIKDHGGTGELDLVTLKSPVALAGGLQFWFRDLPFNANTARLDRPNAGINPLVWKDFNLPKHSYEWRLYGSDNQKDFGSGNYRIPLGDLFELEPLRLLACELKDDEALGSITILCRLHLRVGTATGSKTTNTIQLTITGTAISAVETICSWDLGVKEQANRRQVQLRGKPSWHDGKFGLEDISLTTDFFGMETTLSGSRGTDGSFSFKAADNVDPTSFNGLLLSMCELTLGEHDATFTAGWQISICPAATEGNTKRTPLFAIPARDSNELFKDLKTDTVDLKWTEAEGAIVCSVTPKDGKHVTLLGLKGSIALTVAGTLEAVSGKPGVWSFRSARIDGLWVSASNLRAEILAKYETSWDHTITLSGTLTGTSALQWPMSITGEPRSIPWPKKSGHVDSANDGCVTITASGSREEHTVTYLLDGHAITLGQAAAAERSAGGLIVLVVAALHELRAGGETRFRSFDTIAIGRASVLIPKPPETPADSKDSVAWAPRYRDLLQNGPDKPAPGMVRSGVGRLSTVFKGFLGYPFRTAFWNDRAEEFDPILLIGGFCGFVWGSGNLLRLPSLVSLDGADIGHFQQGSGKVDLSWADGPAQMDVTLVRGLALSPASTSAKDLLSLMGQPKDGVLWGMPVEQSFSDDLDDLKPGDASNTLFFPASAASVSKLLASADKNKSSEVLSLVSGVHSSSNATLAATFLCSTTDSFEALRPAALATMILIGESVITEPISDGGTKDLSVLSRAAAQRCLQLLAKPVLAMVIRWHGKGSMDVEIANLPHRPKRAGYRAPNEQAFPDAGRGYCLAPDFNGSAYLEEGPTTPFRDEATGVPGTGREAALPAGATAKSEDPKIPSNPLWIAKYRTPVWLPLHEISGVNSPSLSWLAPGQPLARLPIAADPDGQWIVPVGANVSSISDRPGISVVRVMRLEEPSNAITGFDDRHARFGRPGTAGPACLGNDRSPRPGPLPENKALTQDQDEEQDRESGQGYRRTCASTLRPAVNCDFLIGPADVISGGNADGSDAWVARFIAQQEEKGRIPDPWDGIITLDFAVESESIRLFPKLLNVLSAQLKVNGSNVQLTPPTSFEGSRLKLKTASPSGIARFAEAMRQGGLVPQVVLEVTLRPAAQGQPESVLRFPLTALRDDRKSLPLVPLSIIFTDPSYNEGLGAPTVEDQKGDTRLAVEQDRANPGGSVLLWSQGPNDASIIFRRIRRGDDSIVVFLTDIPQKKKLITVNELHTIPLSDLSMEDVTDKATSNGFVPALLAPGDILEISVSRTDGTTTGVIVRVTITNQPLFEPPPALYEAMVAKMRGDLLVRQLSIPLHAQSPYPARIELLDALQGFKDSYLRRRATFIWTLVRPAHEVGSTKVFVVKMDRNGQTYLPERHDEFVSPMNPPLQPKSLSE